MRVEGDVLVNLSVHAEVHLFKVGKTNETKKAPLISEQGL